jgi:DNA-binding CsgD family transcriptional regulator
MLPLHERVPALRRVAAAQPKLGHAPESTQAILIADVRGNALYASRAAAAMLLWPHPPGTWAEASPGIAKRLQALLASSADHGTTWPPAVAFSSGRRRYICRSTPLESPPGVQPTWVLALERESAEPDALCMARRRYRFTDREGEVVRLLVAGMVTKEIAEHMGISVNTVKAFIRLVMGKMGVTTRSGIVGKTLSSPGA